MLRTSPARTRIVTSGATTPVRHRYVHGGFEGTETQFSLYFPPDDEYAGRFLHNIEGGGGGSDEAGVVARRSPGQ